MNHNLKLKISSLALAAMFASLPATSLAESSGDLAKLSPEQRRAATTLTMTGDVTPEALNIIRDEMINLRSLDLSATTMTELPPYALAGMSSLNSLTLPASLTEIGPAALLSCSAIERLDLPAGVTKIGNLAFSRSSLRHISIGAGMTSLGKDVFTHCRELATITVDPANPAYIVENGALFTADRTRLIKRPPHPADNSNTLSLPAGLKHIDAYACEGSTTMQMPEFPDGLESIGEYAFMWCPAMAGRLKLPASLREIGDGAFFGASLVTGTLTIPEQITSTGENSFSYMPRLTTIELPAELTAVGAGAFECNSATATIRSSAEVPPTVGAYAMRGIDRSRTYVEVPSSSISAYRAAEVWSTFANYESNEAGSREMFAENGEYRIRYVGPGEANGKYLTLAATDNQPAIFVADSTEASVWTLDFFTVTYTALKFCGEKGSDIYYLTADKYCHINFAGLSWSDPISAFSHNANRTFGFYLEGSDYTHNEGPLVAIAGNGTLWRASDNGLTLATRTFSDRQPSESDFLFRLEPKNQIPEPPLPPEPPVSGIDAVDAEEGPCQYFNLSGMPVSRPEAGSLYIKVTADGKASKVKL